MTSQTKSLKNLETSSLTDKQLQTLQTLPPKTIARQSKQFFAHYYLGLDVPTHQANWYDLLTQYPLEFLLSPRDHGKTTVLPRVITEHDTLYNKSFNTLLLSKTFKQAKKSLDVIKIDLTKNKKIQHDFQEELNDFHKKDNMLFYNMEGVRRDATIESNGLLGDITGGHFHRIILDDIIDDENCRTTEGRRNVWKWINGTILPLLEPDGTALGIGTRKHYEDAYHEMKKNPAWYVIEERAIITEPDSYDYVYDKNGIAINVVNITGQPQVLWPQKWPINKLLLKKAAMGSTLFNREYNNDTTAMKGKILREEWLEYYAINPENTTSDIKGPPPLNSMTIYQGYDIAIREKEINDYFVATTLGVTYDPTKIYILDWYRARLPFPEQVKLVKKLYYGPLTPIWKGIKWDVDLIGIESNAYQVALKQQVLNETVLPIREVVSVKNKTSRIMAGSVNYENGLVYVPVDHPEYQNFFEEYSTFDEGDHDDMIDSTDITMRLLIQEPTIQPDISTVPIW